MVKQLFENYTDRAVSPVIGVVLMVGIIVALGAVVGTAVLSTGTSIGDTAPQAQFEITQEGDTVTITHVSGDTIDPETIQVNGQPGTAVFGAEPISAGDSGTYTVNNGDEKVTITSKNGDNSAILSQQAVDDSASISGPTLQTVTVVDESFDDGSYTDTFSTFGGSDGTKTVTSTDPVSQPNRLELNIDNPPVGGGSNGISTTNTYKNVTTVSMDLNRSGDIQTSWEVGVQQIDQTTGEIDVVSLQARPVSPTEQAVFLIEQNESRLINETQITSPGLPRDQWKDVTLEIQKDSVTATVNGESGTLETVNNHKKMDNGISIGSVTPTETSPVQLRVDNVVVENEQVV